ncbi:Bug family tripartite tricarboxylate transporter substrate binding protein [Bordetella genomosp. 10]|uniref:Bug family tripartite tricarboxylate transporter substrate binding protein n=1 Tax=Bordetella genomosp. 10 TaxID=1416804 RepID=UPI00211AB898|nr:tripartite tricarboxylate transporter substrate binding protein [Bordetella genomosp. 10]
MRKSIFTALAAVSIAAAPAAASADTYPSKPITIVVPYGAGGTNDILARALAAGISPLLGQSVIVSNRAGAGGNLGAAYVANSAPDGYTLLLASSGVFAINKWLYKNLPYDPATLAPVMLAGKVPNVLLASPTLPVNSEKELIAYAKENPGKLNFASMGTGTSGHLMSELFKQQAGIQAQHVPYKGSTAALTDMLGGQVQLMFDNLPTALPQVKSGKLRALAVSTEKRTPLLPDVPTVAEAGVPGFEATAWFGVAAPAGTPADIIAKLNKAMVKVMEDPKTKEMLEAQGVTYSPNTAAEFAAFIASESPKWKKVVEISGATAD